MATTSNPLSPEYRHLLASIDFSQVSAVVVARALNLANLYKARLDIVTVLEDLPLFPEPYGDFATQIIDSEQWDLLRKMTEARLSDFAKEHNVPEEVSLKVLSGTPKVEIAHYAKEQEIDLIVIGSHGHKGVLAILGSTADGVAHRVDCDLLTTRAK